MDDVTNDGGQHGIVETVVPAGTKPCLGMGVGEKAETGCRHWETAEDGGSLLLRVRRVSTDKQETPGATGSNRKPTEAWQ